MRLVEHHQRIRPNQSGMYRPHARTDAIALEQ
jgi:hypothetical protein